MGGTYLGWGVSTVAVPHGRYTPPPSQGWYHRDRTADGVLETLQSVCLLRSRRRTFLFLQKYGFKIFYFIYCYQYVFIFCNGPVINVWKVCSM